MQEKTPISIMIHDLNPWGGQDRSMLEIAWQLNKKFPLEIHSFTLEGYDQWPNMQHVKYETPVKKPIIFKYWAYQLKSFLNLRNKKKEGQETVIQSTGTASLDSDVVQVQFVHHSWEKVRKKLPKDKTGGFNPLKATYHRWLKSYKHFLEKRIYSPNKHFIAISHAIKKELMEHFEIPDENITIIYHGVDTEHFKPCDEHPEGNSQRNQLRKDLGYSEDDIVFLHAGALNARKGLFQALETLAHLKNCGFSQVKYLAVGQGDPSILDETIKKLNIEDLVQVVSHTKDIRQYYWASDVFFFPTQYEPFGLVILEAMACGLPTATTHSAGAAELIFDGNNGVLFSASATPEKITKKLEEILRSKDERLRMGKAARETSLAHTWDDVGQSYIQFYDKMMDV